MEPEKFEELYKNYEIMVNNRQVNPMTVSLPTGKRIDSQHLEAFKKIVTKIDKEVLSHGTVRFAGMGNAKITN